MSKSEATAFVWDVAGQVVSVVGVLAVVLLGLALLGEIRK